MFLSKSYTCVWEEWKYFISYSVNKELKQTNLDVVLIINMSRISIEYTIREEIHISS